MKTNFKCHFLKKVIFSKKKKLEIREGHTAYNTKLVEKKTEKRANSKLVFWNGQNVLIVLIGHYYTTRMYTHEHVCWIVPWQLQYIVMCGDDILLLLDQFSDLKSQFDVILAMYYCYIFIYTYTRTFAHTYIYIYLSGVTDLENKCETTAWWTT